MRGTVAVIEDDADIRGLVCEVLQADQFEVRAFPTPDLKQIAEHAAGASVVIVDLMLPGTTGVELASRLQESSLAGVPMIAMSASRIMLDLATRSGLFETEIAKPFNLTTLLQAVEQCCYSDVDTGPTAA